MKAGRFFILLVLFLHIPLMQHAQIKMEAIPGVRPSSEDINDVNKRIETIQSKLASRDYRFTAIEQEITYLDEKVQKLKTAYKRYKKAAGWDEEIAKMREEVAAVKKETELYHLVKDIETRIANLNQRISAPSYSFENAEKDVKAAHNKLVSLQEKEPTSDKISGFETELAEIAATIHADNVHHEVDLLLKKINPYIESFNAEPTNTRASALIELSGEFKEKYAAYSTLSAEKQNESILASINDVNTFYETTFASKAVPMVSEEVSNKLKKAKENYLLDPKDQLKNTIRGLELAENMKAYLGTTQFDAQIAELTELKTTIDAYIADGGVEKAKLEAQIMNKPVGRFPSEEATIKKLLESRDYGTVVAVSMQDATWSTTLNDFGRPDYKSKWFNAICQKDGKCYLLSGSFRKSYEGNGKYNAGGFFYHPLKGYYPMKNEMNCDNINKRK